MDYMIILMKKKSHVVPALIKKLFKNKSKLEVWGDKKVTRDFVFVMIWLKQ